MAQRTSRSSSSTRRATLPVPASPACPRAAEIATLRALMLERGSPGARLIIKSMEAYDVALNAMRVAQGDFRPGDHRKGYVPDRKTLRFIFLKKQVILTEMVEHWEMFETTIESCFFDLSEENTALPPEPPWVELWYASRRREAQREARLARAERAARRRIRQGTSSRSATAGTSSRTKTQTGDDC